MLILSFRSFTINAGNGPQAEPAVIRTTPVKGVFWFKAIKSFIFGKIELRFEVINKSGYLNSNQLPEPLVFVIDVSVDIHGNTAPDTSLLVGLGDGSYYDYVYDESRSSEGDGGSDDGGDSDGNRASNLKSSSRGSRVSRRKRQRETVGTGSYTGTLSKYEAGTIYDPDYISKPRYSYASGGTYRTAKLSRYAADSTALAPSRGRGSRRRMSRLAAITSAPFNKNKNRSISPSPDLGERLCGFNDNTQALIDCGPVGGSRGGNSRFQSYSKVENPAVDDYDGITLIEHTYHQQQQSSTGQTHSMGSGAYDDIVARMHSLPEYDATKKGQATAADATPEVCKIRLPRFRSFSRDPGDVEESETERAEDGKNEVWANPFAGEEERDEKKQYYRDGGCRDVVALGEVYVEPDMGFGLDSAPSFRYHQKQHGQPQSQKGYSDNAQDPAQEQEQVPDLQHNHFNHALLGGRDAQKDTYRDSLPPSVKIPSNADIAPKSDSSSKLQEQDAAKRSRASASATAVAIANADAEATGAKKTRIPSIRSQRTNPVPAGAHIPRTIDDQWEFLDPLQSPEQAFSRISNLLNLKSTQQSLLHALEVSVEFDSLLKQSRNDARFRNGGSRKTETEMYYKTMAQRLDQLRGMLEARKALDSALLSLLNQGCS